MPELTALGLLASFIAGVVSFLSPCVLPLVPGYVAYIAGDTLDAPDAGAALHARLRVLPLAAFFVLGFSTVFIALGASATALGQVLLSYRYQFNLAAGGVVAVFGLMMTGLLRPALLQRDFRLHIDLPGGRPAAAYIIGLAFAFGWTPCIGPVLGTILTASSMTATLSRGAAMLSVYSLGLGLPFIAAAVFTERLLQPLRNLRRAGRWLQVGAGVAMVFMGLAMISGEISTVSYWLLETFPGFARIG